MTKVNSKSEIRKVTKKLLDLATVYGIVPEPKDIMRMNSLDNRGQRSANCTTAHLGRIDAAKIKDKSKSIRRAMAAIEHFGRNDAVAHAFASHALELNNVKF